MLSVNCVLHALFQTEMQFEQVLSATVHPRVHHTHHPAADQVSDTHRGNREDHQRYVIASGIPEYHCDVMTACVAGALVISVLGNAEGARSSRSPTPRA